MTDSFFDRDGPFSLREIASTIDADLADRADPDLPIANVARSDTAGPGDITYVDGKGARERLADLRASACIVPAKLADQVPPDTAVLIHKAPELGFARAIGLFYPDAVAPGAVFDRPGSDMSRPIHPTAELEDGVHVEPGAVIGAGARIGAGSQILAGAIIGRHVAIGRDCRIGPRAVVTHALVGDRVIVHAGVVIGQDGFGFVPGKAGHVKIPQVGRVIVQDDVEIGANSTIDRGGLADTVIGEGTKIDNLVQIGHNVVLGRHCVIVSQVGIAGSAVLGDVVFVGGQTGIQGHVTIADGARIAAISTVGSDIPTAGDWGGVPAQPVRDWMREHLALKRLAREALDRGKKTDNDG